METKLRDELLQSKKAHTQLQFQFEQATLELPRLKVVTVLYSPNTAV